MGNLKSANPNFASFFYAHIFMKQPVNLSPYVLDNQNTAHPKKSAMLRVLTRFIVRYGRINSTKTDYIL